MGVNGGAVYLLRGLVWGRLSPALADLEILSGSRGRPRRRTPHLSRSTSWTELESALDFFVDHLERIIDAVRSPSITDCGPLG